MPNIPAYKAWCEDCGVTFRVPVLSDFAYGEFIACDRSGTLFGYLDANHCPAWDLIKAIYSELGLPTSDASRFQSIVGDCFDPIDGKSLGIVGGHRCPRCGSERVSYRDLPSDRHGSLDVLEVSFHRFLALSVENRRRFIADSASRRS